MQWTWSSTSTIMWYKPSGSFSFSAGSLLLFLALLGKASAESYTVSSHKEGMVFTASQNLGELWPLDQLVHLHIVVKHPELDAACEKLKQAEKHLRGGLTWEDIVVFIRQRKR